MASLNMTSSSRKPCEGAICDGKGQPTFFCVQCDSNFCNPCWIKQRPHAPEKRMKHEQTDLLVVDTYRSILEPSSDPKDQEDLHRSDEGTTWFGVGQNKKGNYKFKDYDRFATLMADSLSAECPVRYPRIVSFIGQTGKTTSRNYHFVTDCRRRWQELSCEHAHCSSKNI